MQVFAVAGKLNACTFAVTSCCWILSAPSSSLMTSYFFGKKIGGQPFGNALWRANESVSHVRQCPLTAAAEQEKRDEFLAPGEQKMTRRLKAIQTKEQLANLLDEDRGHDEPKIAEKWLLTVLLMIQAALH